MDSEIPDGQFQLQHLAGGDIIALPPVYAPSGDFLFLISVKVVQVFSTTTGELVRKLSGSSGKLISLEMELGREDILVACSNTGELLRWKWRTGKLEDKIQMRLPDGDIKTFNLINHFGNSNRPHAFVTLKHRSDAVQWCVVNTEEGSRVTVPMTMRLTHKTPMVAAGRKNFKYLALAQGPYVFFVNYESWTYTRLKNAHKVPITVVRFHPTEEMVATGDERGKIFLWRQFMDSNTVRTSLYHWHHTSITSIAFSSSGASFYSSGLEAVLVKWNLALNQKTFIPRICSIVRHISVNDDNSQVAICTADNGVQIVGNDDRLKITLQQFTYVMDDKTEKSKFPVGLLLNPRTNTLVLNGRVGSLQFYSAYTKNLLYNMDIVNQNRLSVEAGKILYDIRVTKAAFNIDWMATGEEFNDEQHLPELRLKFWKYKQGAQCYELNTNIELPHEGGFKAIEFSSDYQVDNLLCATVGSDNVIKVWSLEESDNIYRQGKVWYCVAQTSYKNMPIESISFSRDGSLLAAGFGNCLCIYKSSSLKLRVALSSPPGLDGGVQKAQVCVPKREMNGSKNEIVERRKKILQLFQKIINGGSVENETALVKEMQKSLQISGKTKTRSQAQETPDKSPAKLDNKQKSLMFHKIQDMPELNLYQKLTLYQKLGIGCEVPSKWQTKMTEYLHSTVARSSISTKTRNLHERLHRLNMRDRFKAKYRMREFVNRKKMYNTEIGRHLVPIMSVLGLSDTVKAPKHLPNGNHMDDETPDVEEEKEKRSATPLPQQSPAEIRRVQFASNEFAHLVVVCTDTRLLVWNLMTLRLESSLKMSIKHLAFDPQSNIMAAFTETNDLYVFQPNVPLPLYQRSNLPALHGAVWLPRRHPKQRSIHLDWQAQSTLYFLTESQEIMFLGTSDDLASDAPPPIAFTNAEAPEGLRYTTFGTYATQRFSAKQSLASQQQNGGPLIVNDSTAKSAVKALIEMSTHTMPPMSMLCEDFLRSMVKYVEAVPATATATQTKSSSKNYRSRGHSGLVNGYADDDEDDGDDDDVENEDDDVIMINGDITHEMDNGNDNSSTDRIPTESMGGDNLRTRKEILLKSDEINHQHQRRHQQQQQQQPQKHNQKSQPTTDTTESLLQRIAAESIELEL